MANYFNPGEEKIRPGVYFNHQKQEEEVTPGAVDGIVAVLFKSSMGPLGAVTVLSAKEGYKDIYGEGGTTDVLRETFYGGASKVIAVRVGNGGKAGMASLSCESGTVEIAAKYPGAAKFTVTVREKLTNSAQKECIVYLDDMEFEKVTFAAGENEAEALKKAFEASKNFAVTVKDATGAVTAVSQTAFSGGEDPKCTNADYSAALQKWRSIILTRSVWTRQTLLCLPSWRHSWTASSSLADLPLQFSHQNRARPWRNEKRLRKALIQRKLSLS